MRDTRLLFGPLAALIFAALLIGLPLFVPGYNSVHQTVSEIGEADSPMRWPFFYMIAAASFCLVVFALGVWRACRDAGHNAFSAALIVAMAASALGVGYFAFPHPLHNVFGISELIGYQAPLAFVLAWRKDANARGVVAFTWAMLALLWISILLNLAKVIGLSAIADAMHPFYGLVQRSLFAVFFVWIAGLGLMLRNRVREPQPA